MSIDIDDLIAQARAQYEETEPTDIPLILAGEQITVRLRRIESIDYRNLVAKFPPRAKTPSDHNRGYDVTGVASHYPAVTLVDGDKEIDLAERWPALTRLLAAEDMKLVEYTVWGINEYDPIQAALGKAQQGETSSSPSSPESSASPSES